MQKITVHLWFDNQAEEAAAYYTGIFKNAKVLSKSHYGQEATNLGGVAPGQVMQVEFELDGQRFLALNGGPDFHFTEAISLLVACEDQAEVDDYWEQLGAGGDPSAQICGWLKDKYGLSWQIVPTELEALMNSSNPAQAERVKAAMLQMKKLDIAQLRAAAG